MGSGVVADSGVAAGTPNGFGGTNGLTGAGGGGGGAGCADAPGAPITVAVINPAAKVAVARARAVRCGMPYLQSQISVQCRTAG
jgi:hypothetical protein